MGIVYPEFSPLIYTLLEGTCLLWEFTVNAFSYEMSITCRKHLLWFYNNSHQNELILKNVDYGILFRTIPVL